MAKRAYEKMGIKPYNKVLLVNLPDNVTDEVTFPRLNTQQTPIGEFDHILLFVRTQHELHESFTRLKSHLTSQGKLWVIWPKAKKISK